MVTETKEQRDYWSEDGQVFFCGGTGWGLTPELGTINLDKETDILAIFQNGAMAKDLGPLQRQVLTEILEKRKELPRGANIEIKRPSAVRSRPVRAFKCRKANLRQATTGKRAAVYKT